MSLVVERSDTNLSPGEAVTDHCTKLEELTCIKHECHHFDCFASKAPNDTSGPCLRRDDHVEASLSALLWSKAADTLCGKVCDDGH